VILTRAAATPSVCANSATTAAFAAPPCAGLLTATFSASPSGPTTRSRDAPGTTLTANRTPPS